MKLFSHTHSSLSGYVNHDNISSRSLEANNPTPGCPRQVPAITFLAREKQLRCPSQRQGPGGSQAPGTWMSSSRWDQTQNRGFQLRRRAARPAVIPTVPSRAQVVGSGTAVEKTETLRFV